MSTYYSAAIKIARMNVVLPYLNGGKLRVFANSGAANIDVTLQNPAGVQANGYIAFNGLPWTLTPSATGTLDGTASLLTSAGDLVMGGIVVGTSSAHITVASMSITSGVPFYIRSFSLAHGL